MPVVTLRALRTRWILGVPVAPVSPLTPCGPCGSCVPLSHAGRVLDAGMPFGPLGPADLRTGSTGYARYQPAWDLEHLLLRASCSSSRTLRALDTRRTLGARYHPCHPSLPAGPAGPWSRFRRMDQRYFDLGSALIWSVQR